MKSASRLRGLPRFVVAFVLLVGCQAGPSASASAPATSTAAPATGAPATAPATAAPTAGAAGTPLPSLVHLELGTGPMLTADDGPANSAYSLPGAAALARDGSLVLVIVWFPSDNALPTIAVSRSTDEGATWTVGTTNILEGLEIGDPDPGPIPAALLQLDDGSWQLYGWSADPSSSTRFWSWRTSAQDIEGPWVVDKREMLEPGPAGAWDSQMAAAASVHRTAEGYTLWYEGEPPGTTNRGDIGLATSTDGLAWTKFDDPATTGPEFAASDPVIKAGACGPGTEVALDEVQVERVGDRYVALFGGFGATGHSFDVYAALSDDGRSWQCATPEPLLTGAGIPGSEGIHTMASVALGDGRIGLVLESLVPSQSELWWATVEVDAE